MLPLAYAYLQARLDKPLMLWDGECGFCARWIARFHKVTGNTISYAPYQQFETDKQGNLKRFPNVSAKDCKRAVQLLEPDGTRYEAAEAVLRALAHADRLRWLLWLYEHLPGFAWCSERLYRLVAQYRRFL